MGHYDDHYARSDQEQAERKEKMIQERTLKIERRIMQVGYARALAEIEHELRYR